MGSIGETFKEVLEELEEALRLHLEDSSFTLGAKMGKT